MLNAAKFTTVRSMNMGINSPPKNLENRTTNTPPRLPPSQFRTQLQNDPRQYSNSRKQEGEISPDSSVAVAPPLLNETATMQRMQDIATSLEQVSIVRDASPISSLQAGKCTENLQQQSGLNHPGALTPTLPANTSPKLKKKRIGGRDEKTLPSEGSGGVPNVTQKYLEGCLAIPQPLGNPQNLLIVIDLNGTLLYRPSRMAPRKFLTRPHARLFLKYCVETFTVVIWSSARPENVKAMCDVILPGNLRTKVAAIWGRDKFNLTQQDYNLRVQCYKRLEKLWEDPKIAATHPSHNFGGRWDQTNTVLIDDSLEKARTEPHNLIEVPEWFGDLRESDDILPQVHDHLNYLSLHSNVSACLRAHPFKPQIGGVYRPQ